MSQQADTAADAAVQQLAAAGLNVCFANPGTTEMFLVAALEKQKHQVRSILCLHEAVCTGACDGYARIAGAPAVALLHLGPGLGNGLCHLHNAHRARSPVLVLVGEHATWHKGADPPLAQNIQALASTVSREVLAVTSAETAVSTVQQALAALAKPVPPIISSDGGGVLPAITAAGAAAAPKAVSGVTDLMVQICPASRVVTVVFPHDISWTPVTGPSCSLLSAQPSTSATTTALLPPSAAAAAGVPLSPAAATAAAGDSQPSLHQLTLQQRPISLSDSPAAQRFLSDCAVALKAAPRGKAALVLGGAALLTEGTSDA